MKRSISLAAFCLLPCITLAAAKLPPNPANYPLTVHVIASRALLNIQQPAQQLVANVDGHQVELTGSSPGVLALGDYKARMTGTYQPVKPNAYDLYIVYEFLFPDGHTRPYTVTGLEPAGGSATVSR